MNGEEREEQRKGFDRRASAWSDPKLWVSVLAIVLSVGITILSVIASLLFSINAKLEAQALQNNSAQKDIEFLKGREKERHIEDMQRDTYIANARERILKLEAARENQLSQEK